MTELCSATGKHGYPDRTAASKAKTGINTKRIKGHRPAPSRNSTPATVYRCRACGMWHIGRER